MSMRAACIRRCARRSPIWTTTWRGVTRGARGWLRAHLQQHGSLYEPRQVIAQAAGMVPGEGPLLDYLEAKFRDLYSL